MNSVLWGVLKFAVWFLKNNVVFVKENEPVIMQA